MSEENVIQLDLGTTAQKATAAEKLDKDRFRRDLGGVEDAYAEMMKRVGLN